MPLVKNFPQRFALFRQFANSVKRTAPNVDRVLLKDIKRFEESVKAHLSFDTYFKKLFHQQEESEIIRQKSVLLLFFLFEHLIIPDMIPPEFPMDYSGCEDSPKKLKLDLRYDALIAGLLKPKKNQIEFYTKINFITWNYDANLFLALRNFLDPNQPFKEFILRNYNQGFFQFGDQVKVFHLNGFINHPAINMINKPDSLKSFMELFSEDNYPSLESCAKNILFSWEQDSFNEQEIEKVIANSNNIVLIGYSLPLYNRVLDLKILKKSNLSRKQITIQDVNPRGIAEILESDFGFDSVMGSKTKEDPIFRMSENCSSFVVPNSIFTS